MQKRKVMKQNKYPPGWDDERIQRVLTHYEDQTEEEEAAEDEAAYYSSNQTFMGIPNKLAVVRDLIAKLQEARGKRLLSVITPSLPPDKKTFNPASCQDIPQSQA